MDNHSQSAGNDVEINRFLAACTAQGTGIAFVLLLNHLVVLRRNIMPGPGGTIMVGVEWTIIAATFLLLWPFLQIQGRNLKERICCHFTGRQYDGKQLKIDKARMFARKKVDDFINALAHVNILCIGFMIFVTGGSKSPYVPLYTVLPVVAYVLDIDFHKYLLKFFVRSVLLFYVIMVLAYDFVQDTLMARGFSYSVNFELVFGFVMLYSFMLTLGEIAFNPARRRA